MTANFNKNLSMSATAIGSLPHSNYKDALGLIFDNFKTCPFWPQLSHVNRLEDMTTQYLQGFPGIEYDEKNSKFFFNTQSEAYFEQLEEFFFDYEAIVSEKNYDNLEKYAITGDYSSALPMYFEKLSDLKPEFAKGHIIGPLTLGTSITDENGRCSFYDDVLREIIVKGLTLKAVWQIRKMKEASGSVLPIIFMDEPAMSQYGTSALLTIEKSDIISAVKEISAAIQEEGALCGVHCCGKTDWTIILESDVNILNFDAFSFAQSLALYAKEVEMFMQDGGYVAWGVVPTLDAEALEKSSEESLSRHLEDAMELLVQKGVDKNLILEHSILTPSCGAGGLNVELAQKAMEMTVKLSERLKQKYAEVFA